MKVKNCTLDTRTLIAVLPSGAKAVLRLAPGEVSKDFDPEVIDVLRSNKAVDLLFKNKLVCEWPLKTKPKPKAAAAAPKPEDKPKTKKKKGKGKPKKLDLGV